MIHLNPNGVRILCLSLSLLVVMNRWLYNKLKYTAKMIISTNRARKIDLVIMLDLSDFSLLLRNLLNR